MTTFDFDDLSFSSIVNQIQGDEKECKNFIIEAYYEIEKTKKEVEEIKKNLHIAESYQRSLENSIELAMKNVNWKKPLALIINNDDVNELLVISESAITLEKNVY